MNAKPHTGLEIHMLPSRKNITLQGAQKFAGITDDLPVEVLRLYPNAAEGQRSNQLTRLTALNAARKWSHHAYHWCIGLVGFSPSELQHTSFLTHTATHGNARDWEKAHLRTYRYALQRMLDAADNPARCDVVLFGGMNDVPYATEFRDKLTAMTARISGLRPIIIPSKEEDTMLTPKSKHVLMDTPGGRLFFFEPGLKKNERNRVHRLGDTAQ